MLKGKGKIRFLGLILMLVCLVQPVSAQAVSYAPYATYTYSLDQEHFYAYSQIGRASCRERVCLYV